MRTLKLLLVAVLMSTSAMAVAFPNGGPGKRASSVSFEIESMLSNSNLVIEEEVTVSVLFTLSEDKRIQIKCIKSDNEEVVAFLNDRLDQKKVYGGTWTQHKLYELPVKVQARR